MKRATSLLVALLFSLILLSPVSGLAAVENGADAPNFSAKTFGGEDFSLDTHKGSTIVLEWFNPKCPFVLKHYKANFMQKLQNEYAAKGVKWVVVSSTNPENSAYLEPAEMQAKLSEWKVDNAIVLNDPTGKVGKLYGAKTTPHMFVINPEGKIVYQGAIDDESDYDADPTKSTNYVKAALDQLAAGEPVTVASTKPYGCSVKYAD